MQRRVRAARSLWSAALGAWLASAPAVAAEQLQSVPPQKVTCSVASMVEELRSGLKAGSPAYQRYVRAMMKEAALGLPLAELRAAFERERDPAVVEALAATLAARSGRTSDVKQIASVLARASSDPEPAARAAAVRGLRGMGSVDAMAKLGELSYAQLIRSQAPEVREAVVGNLIEESAQVFSGHDRAVSEMAISAAAASPDPEAAAKLLSEVSMEQIGPKAAQTLADELRADSPKLRAGAATALGGVPGPESAAARSALMSSYRTETDPSVRKAMLEAVVRLGPSQAGPALESLRGVDASLSPEIDAWTQALKSNLQEWSLLKRQKELLRK